MGRRHRYISHAAAYLSFTAHQDEIPTNRLTRMPITDDGMCPPLIVKDIIPIIHHQSLYIIQCNHILLYVCSVSVCYLSFFYSSYIFLLSLLLPYLYAGYGNVIRRTFLRHLREIGTQGFYGSVKVRRQLVVQNTIEVVQSVHISKQSSAPSVLTKTARNDFMFRKQKRNSLSASRSHSDVVRFREQRLSHGMGCSTVLRLPMATATRIAYWNHLLSFKHLSAALYSSVG